MYKHAVLPSHNQTHRGAAGAPIELRGDCLYL